MKKILIIPDRIQLEQYLELAKEYNLGFEYNDFFMPDILDSKEKLNDIVESYKKYELPQFSTMHGDFFDVIPFSFDSKIREISDLRIRQSLDVARQMKVQAVVFHTNYNPFLNTKQYIERWIKQNTEYWNSVLEENQDVNIYLENMFDTTPDILERLSEGLRHNSNFGLCLDYAHAAISGVKPEIWAKQLGKYVKHIHINDNDGNSDLHLAWGNGNIDRNAFYDSYEKYMKEASVLIETNSYENITRSLTLLEKEGFL